MEAKESPYYMGNKECVPTTLSIKTFDKVVNIELPWDVSTPDLVHAFYTAAVGVTFIETDVLKCMKEFVESRENIFNYDRED